MFAYTKRMNGSIKINKRRMTNDYSYAFHVSADGMKDGKNEEERNGFPYSLRFERAG